MLEWTDHLGNRRTGVIPPNIRVFVDLIGFKTTVDLMLALGGTFVCFPRDRPKPDGLLAKAIGMDAALILGREFFGAPQRIPISGRFLARCLRGRGCSVQDIARQLRRTDKTIRIYLKADKS